MNQHGRPRRNTGMLHRIAIRNFQSLQAIDLELAPLTVIVGPSSVGKSAFTRALRTLVSNQRGHALITHGERIASVSVTTDRGTVTLTRGSTTKDNSYTVTPAGQPDQRVEYGKLSGTVPEEVSAFLGIPADSPINFAGQFDAPYLLAAGGSVAAKTLGDLTNVAVIFDSARESNRQKLAAGSTLTTRRADLSAVEEALPQFADLPEQLEALDAVEQLIEHARSITFQQRRLDATVTALRDSSAQLAQLSPYAEQTIPSEQAVVAAHGRVTALAAVIVDLRAATEAYHQHTAAVEAAEADIQALEAAYLETLHSAGQCPTCGQTTERIHA